MSPSRRHLTAAALGLAAAATLGASPAAADPRRDPTKSRSFSEARSTSSAQSSSWAAASKNRLAVKDTKALPLTFADQNYIGTHDGTFTFALMIDCPRPTSQSVTGGMG